MKKIILTLLVASFGMIGCGRAKKAKEQHNPRIEVPAFPQESGLALFPSNKNEKYSGSTIVWHENVTSKEIAAVALASRNTRIARAKEFEYQIKVHEPYITSLENKQKQLRSDISDLNKQTIQKSALIWAPEVSGLFTKRTQDLLTAGSINQTQKDQSATVYELFCESEIWRFASSATLSLASYQKRPTPNQMCEGFYNEIVAGKKRFFDGELCKDESNKTYFACLWQEGVLRTKMFESVGNFETAGRKRRDIVNEWTKTNSSFLAKYLLAADPNTSKTIMDLAKFDANQYLAAVAKIPAADLGPYGDVTYREALWGITSRVATDPLSRRVTPGYVQRFTTNINPSGMVNNADATWFGKDSMDLHNGMAEIFRALSTRESATDLTASDYIFNMDRVTALTDAQATKANTNYLAAQNQATLKPIFDKGDTSLLTTIAAKKSEIVDLDGKIAASPTTVELARLDNIFIGIQSAARETVLAPNTSRSFWVDSRLEYLSDGDNFSVKFRLTESGDWMAGTYSVSKKEFLTCPVAEGKRCADLVVEPEKGHIKMKMLFDKPEASGFKQKLADKMTDAEKRAGFNDLDPEELKGKFLVIDFYQNNLYGVMNYFSVTTKFCSADETNCVREGAMTLTP